MRVGSSWPMMATTRGPCSTTWATRTSSTQSDTPNGAQPLQEFLALTGGGKLGTASPSITLAFAAASRCAISASIISIARSISSSVIALTPPERGGPISPIGFHRLIQRLGEAAKMPFPIHPHMLRHACGFKLANDGHDTRALQHYLGHKNIQHTVRY